MYNYCTLLLSVNLLISVIPMCKTVNWHWCRISSQPVLVLPWLITACETLYLYCTTHSDTFTTLNKLSSVYLPCARDYIKGDKYKLWWTCLYTCSIVCKAYFKPISRKLMWICRCKYHIPSNASRDDLCSDILVCLDTKLRLNLYNETNSDNISRLQMQNNWIVLTISIYENLIIQLNEQNI